jgi:type VI secretion system secreted protein VgrG
MGRGNAQSRRLVKLDTPLGADWLLPLYVKGTAKLGRDYEFIVDAVSSRGDAIDLNALLGKAVTLWIQQVDGSYMPIHGYAHQFSRLGSDGPLSYYQLRFSSWLYFLRLRRDMRDWQEQSGERILVDVFDEHPRARGAYRFDLDKPLPKYSNRVQWEYDLNFVHRSMEEVGVFPYFVHADNGKSHTMVLTDDTYSLPELTKSTVAFGRMAIGGEFDGFTQWKERQQIESAKLASRSFDYKRPDLTREISGMTDAYRKLSTDGEVYDYPGAYMWSDREHGERLAEVRLDERKSRMKRFHAVGGLRCAMPGRRFVLTGHPVYDAGSAEGRHFVLLGVEWLIRNNLPGLDGIATFPDGLAAEVAEAKAGSTVRHSDGSEGLFQVSVEAQPRTVPFRSPFEHKKPVMQLQTAIVAGPKGEEAYTDALNRVKVWFPWNRRNEQDERASCWVRASFPDAGRNRGGIQPLRKGDEVVVGFMEGDCDRPIIISRVYGGMTEPVWHSNGLLSGLRSKEYGGSGYNQLVLDDSTGQNRVHLYSSSYRSHLHLGYQIEHNGNTRGAFVGSGFDLKSDAYGAIRAGRGLFVSTHPASENQPLNVTAATQQLASAASLVDAVSQSSVANHAQGLGDAHDSMKKFADATQHGVAGSARGGGRTAGGGTGSANGFAAPIMLAASPAGVGLSTQASVHVTADQQINVVSGKSTHVAAGKSLVASVMEQVSLFAQNGGMKFVAGKRDVAVEAHAGAIAVAAQLALKLLSVTDTIEIAADKGILLTSGGAYIRIKDGNIEIHAPGKIELKGASHSLDGPAQLHTNLGLFKQTDGPYDEAMSFKDELGNPIPHLDHLLEMRSDLIKATANEQGVVSRVFSGAPEAIKAYLHVPNIKVGTDQFE